MTLVSLSENTILVLFEQKIAHDIFNQVKEGAYKVESLLSDYIIDIIPSYASIHINFNLTKLTHTQFKTLLESVLNTNSVSTAALDSEKIITIPVYYGPEVALDIELIAARASLSIDAVIDIHSSTIYDVYAIGFAPGFAYLGNVDKRIAIPRKETPRKKIAKGSLGIADQQAAVYPAESPGGWQIIGKTPVVLIDYSSERLTQFEVGNKVKFLPVDREAFIGLGGVI
ncbi:MAG: KipI family sensor histidine kinase inhibitor [Cellvibrionaceae bacterium]|jgi:KipI family sensor histidine kinase inhibitor